MIISLAGNVSALEVETDYYMLNSDMDLVITINKTVDLNASQDVEYTLIVGAVGEVAPFFITSMTLENGTAEIWVSLETAQSYGTWYVKVFNKSTGERVKTEFYLNKSPAQEDEDRREHERAIAGMFNQVLLFAILILVGMFLFAFFFAMWYRDRLNRMKGKYTGYSQFKDFLNNQMMFNQYWKNVNIADMNPLERAEHVKLKMEEEIEDVFKKRKGLERLMEVMKAYDEVMGLLSSKLSKVQDKYGIYPELVRKEKGLQTKWENQLQKLNDMRKLNGLIERDDRLSDLYLNMEKWLSKDFKPVHIQLEVD